MSNENENEYTKGYIDLIFGYLGFVVVVGDESIERFYEKNDEL